MRVCIDIQSAVGQRAGVGRYTDQLVRHMAAPAGQDELTLFCFDFKGKGLSFAGGATPLRRIRWCPGRAVQRAWRAVRWPPFNRFAPGFDLYHFPNFFLPPLTRGRSVVTIHDVSFLRYPHFAERKNLRFLTRHIHRTAESADAIITDSRFSAGEIAELLHVETSRLFPIHLGINPDFRAAPPPRVQALRDRLKLARPYLLTVGTIEPRKNVPFLIDLFERAAGFDGDLVIAGMPGWKFGPILDRMRSARCADRIRYLDYIPDGDLPALYTGAEAFLCASFYEGFGFPPLEAMACGTPVLSSPGGSLREVLGDSAVVLDGFDVDAWTHALQRLLTDTVQRDRLKKMGLRQAARYRWAETARQTWDVYRSLRP